MSRKPSPHDLPPKKIAIIAAIVIGSIVLGTIFTLHVPEQRRNRQRGNSGAGLGHSIPLQQSVGRETNGMVWIPSGSFYMGSTNGAPDEAPVHLVTLSGFWMDKTEVTRAQFEKFARATSYITTDEKANPIKTRNPVNVDPASPMTFVNWDDAAAYAKWAGKRLPTEAEWERAARGGFDRKEFALGDQPNTNGSVRTNGYGLLGLDNGVAEWCADGYGSNYYAEAAAFNPTGPRNSIGARVARGASLRVAARTNFPPDTARANLGFRCVAATP